MEGVSVDLEPMGKPSHFLFAFCLTGHDLWMRLALPVVLTGCLGEGCTAMWCCLPALTGVGAGG
jgi:hypothetical protein